MSHKYKFGPGHYPHFSTMTIVGWIDLFSRSNYHEILYDSWTYCIQQKGWKLHAYVIMSNHVHLISSMEEGSLADLMRDMKKYCSKAFIREIKQSGESRREWLLELFSRNVRRGDHQVWQPGNHPIRLDNTFKLRQKLEYIHNNPIKAGLVYVSEEYAPSSAGAYAGESPRVPLSLLEFGFGDG